MQTPTLTATPADVVNFRPRNAGQLWAWLQVILDIEAPDRARCENHCAPLDYLAHSFFDCPGDPLVWANRGGGKTFYGAVATLLDLWFKPGIEVRILGGSLDQSEKMYEHLRRFLERPIFRGALCHGATQRSLRLRNGSRVQILAQSETSVRGHRVQKVRCDEVELFDHEVWQACQFVTRSAWCGEKYVRGTVEALSTMHRPFGLMKELVEASSKFKVQEFKVGKADGARSSTLNFEPLNFELAAPGGFRLFNWCALDVMAPCPPRLACESCDIHRACRGAAKSFSGGFLGVPDVLAMRARSSAPSFDAEMLCSSVTRSDSVYPGFNPATHVRPIEPDPGLTWIGGMDFGMRSPTVVLWAQVRADREPQVASLKPSLRIEVIDELIAADTNLPKVLGMMSSRPWPKVKWLGVDPSGNQRQSQTGLSTIEVLRREGYRIRDRRVGLMEGLDVVSRWLEACDLRPAGAACGLKPQAPSRRSAVAGHEPLLLIHPRCTGLIEALTEYHFDPDDRTREAPLKDGPDHAADALRYMLTNLDQHRPAVAGNY